MTHRSQPYRLQWPLTADQVEGIDEMFEILFNDLGDVGLTPGVQGTRGDIGIPGMTGPEGPEGAYGPPGLTGATGATGPAGADGSGSLGPPGRDGDDGGDLWWVPASSGNPPFEFTTTTTGNIDNLDFAGASLIRMNNATLATIRGLAAGVAGQRVTIVSIGAGQVDLAHQNTGSAAASRLINVATSASTPLAAGSGSATYTYDGTTARWRLIHHAQGAWITPAYAAGDFTAGGGATWTVDAADVTTYASHLSGSTLTVTFYLLNTSVTVATPANLIIRVPGGFSVALSTLGVTGIDNNNNSANEVLEIDVPGGGTSMNLYHNLNVSNWGLSAGLTNVFGQIALSVT